ncbi:hypothetical protein [Sphingobacterium gobiense]|uniref:Uncharacterized protein n=1 Tax=Sphingobacterium gobiense TaxID=1382456 RepID=A0A2S9JU31_9SPHI|nr:hypothetical protein [Sphingobacterium gobiense]PRD56748.1 hypothetical protein C5749_05835 [Sphingobacterium gobiense]
MSSDRFEFKILKDKDGSETDLKGMSLTESKAFLVLLNSVVTLAENINLDSSYEIKIERGSACVAIEGTDLNPLISEYDKILENRSNNYEAVTAFRNIQSLFWENGLTYLSRYRTADFEETNVYDKIYNSKTFRTKSIRRDKNIEVYFLKGYLQEVGGKKPNFHLDINGNRVKIECTVEQAQRVKNELYKEVHVSVIKRSTAKVTYSFLDYYSDSNIYKEYKDLINSIYESSRLDAVRSVNCNLRNSLVSKNYTKARSLIKLFNNDFTDESILKTILILTKSVPNEASIFNLRSSVKTILEKKRGEELI